jgi:cobalt-zinc-cadmium efflux system outer membrane protein
MFHLLTVLLLVTLGYENAAAESSVDTNADDNGHGHIVLEVDPVLSLQEVVLQTAEREPGSEVVVARREEAAALEKNATRLLAGPPSIEASYVSDGLSSDDGYRQWDVALEFPLWWPGQRSGRRLSARAASSAASHAQRAHALQVAGWVRQAVAELALAGVRLELTEAEWRAEDELAAQIERAVALEELAERDLLLARSASLDRRLLYLEAIEESGHSESSYFLLTGLSSWPGDWSEIPADPESFENHPLLLLAVEETARAQGELDRLSADQWGNPRLAVGTQHEREESGANFDDRIFAGVRIPLGRRSDAQAKIAGARLTLAEARRDHRRLDRELRGHLAKAEHRFSLASERVSTAAEQAEMAAEYMRLTERGFGLGESDLRDLLHARSRSIAAEQAHREAVILKQSSAGQMNQALGVVP